VVTTMVGIIHREVAQTDYDFGIFMSLFYY